MSEMKWWMKRSAWPIINAISVFRRSSTLYIAVSFANFFKSGGGIVVLARVLFHNLGAAI